jgi:hypothetical protein
VLRKIGGRPACHGAARSARWCDSRDDSGLEAFRRPRAHDFEIEQFAVVRPFDPVEVDCGATPPQDRQSAPPHLLQLQSAIAVGNIPQPLPRHRPERLTRLRGSAKPLEIQLTLHLGAPEFEIVGDLREKYKGAPFAVGPRSTETATGRGSTVDPGTGPETSPEAHIMRNWSRKSHAIPRAGGNARSSRRIAPPLRGQRVRRRHVAAAPGHRTADRDRRMRFGRSNRRALGRIPTRSRHAWVVQRGVDEPPTGPETLHSDLRRQYCPRDRQDNFHELRGFRPFPARSADRGGTAGSTSCENGRAGRGISIGFRRSRRHSRRSTRFPTGCGG